MPGKDFTLTREELEKRLEDLRRTSDAFEPVRSFAYCYSPRPVKPLFTARLECVVCGKTLPERRFFRRGFPSIEAEDYLSYVRVAESFVSLGYDAEIRCYCAKHNPNGKNANSNIFFAFRAKGDGDFRESELKCSYADTHDLNAALEFLTDARATQELDGKRVRDSRHGQAKRYNIWALERVLGIGGKGLTPDLEDDGHDG